MRNTDLAEKMRRKGRKIGRRARPVAIGICVGVCLLLLACGDEKEEPGNFVTSVAVPEKSAGEGSDEDAGHEDAGSAAAKDESENEDVGSDSAKDESENGDAGSITAKDESENKDVGKSSAAGSVEIIEGSITAVDGSSFSVAKAFVDGNVMVSTPDDEIISVICIESTEFELCHSSDGGTTCQYTQGSAADLEAGKNVTLEGTYNNSGFQAAKVTIYYFE